MAFDCLYMPPPLPNCSWIEQRSLVIQILGFLLTCSGFLGFFKIRSCRTGTFMLYVLAGNLANIICTSCQHRKCFPCRSEVCSLLLSALRAGYILFFNHFDRFLPGQRWMPNRRQTFFKLVTPQPSWAAASCISIYTYVDIIYIWHQGDISLNPFMMQPLHIRGN